ncbi:MAG TPA: hypothetical protein VJS12_25080 [Steroidobacteraceae bacterium]|nr:hypothetical protein [Steroidobacteraceae bacterium]
MWEVAGGVIVAVIVLAILAGLARKISAGITLRRVQALRDLIAAGSPESESDLTSEQEDKYARTVELVKLKCKHAENYIRENKRDRLDRVVEKCLADADTIDDDFYRGAALRPIATLLRKAGSVDRATAIEQRISVDFIRDETERARPR